MPINIDIIKCKTKDITKTYLFTLFISNKNIIEGNISIFEDLNIGQ